MFLGLIHIKIAEELIKRAGAGNTIQYKELCQIIGYGSPINMGKVLDPLTKFTYENYHRTYISSLVIRNDTQKPGSGFFLMARQRGAINNISEDQFWRDQKEKVFNTNWDSLIPKLSQIIGR